MINANDFLVYFIITIFKFRSTGEGEIIPVGRNAILGGCLLGRRLAGTRHDGHGSRAWRNDGEVKDIIQLTIENEI